MSDDFLIILLSHDEISAFLLSVIVRNSSLLTGVVICLSRKSPLLRLRNLLGHVCLGLCKDKTQREHIVFLQNRFTDKLISAVGSEFSAEF